MNKGTLTDLKERRSVRSFKPDPIKEEELAAILEAGTYAPSGMGLQPSVIIAVENKAIVDKLEKLNAIGRGKADSKPFYGAATVLAVLSDKKSRPSTYQEDGTLVIGNLLNAAYAAGVGSCWIHYARETFESADGKALLKEWGVPDGFVGIGFCILGYPAGPHPEAKPRKPDYIIRVK